MANENNLNITITATDQTRAGLDSARASTQRFSQEVDQSTRVLKDLFSVQGAEGLSSALSSAGKSAAGMANAFTSALDPLQSMLGGISKGVSVIEGEISKISTTAAGLLAIVPIFESINAASRFLTKSLQDASKETDNLNRVAATFTSSGRGSIETAEQFTQKVKELSRTSSYASQDVVQAFNMMASNPKIATKDLMNTTQLAIDMAAASGRSVQEMAVQIGWAANGMYGILHHAGIYISEAAKNSGDFSKVLAEMNQKFAGQEQAKMLSYAGVVGSLSKAFNQVEKAIGHIEEKALLPVLRNLVEYFKTMGKEIEDAFKGGKTDEFAGKLRDALMKLTESAKANISGLVEYIKNMDFDKFLAEVTGLVMAVKSMGIAVMSGLKWLIDLPTWVKQAAGILIVLRIGWSIFGGVIKWVGETVGLLQSRYTQIMGAITGVTRAIEMQTAALRQNAVAANASASAVSRSSVTTGQRMSGGKIIPSPTVTTTASAKSGLGAKLGGMSSGVLAGLAGGGLAAITGIAMSSDTLAPKIDELEGAFKSLTGLNVDGWLRPIAEILAFSLPQAITKLGPLLAGLGGVFTTLSTPLVVLGGAVATIGGLTAKWYLQDKPKHEDKTAENEMKAQGLLMSTDEAKQAMKDQQEAINKGEDANKAAEESARAYAKAGISLEEYRKEWSKTGREVPKSAEDVFKNVRDRIENFDASLERDRSLIESYKTRLYMLMGGDKNATPTGASAQLRMEVLADIKIPPKQKEYMIQQIDQAAKEISKASRLDDLAKIPEKNMEAIKAQMKELSSAAAGADTGPAYKPHYIAADLEQDPFLIKREETEKKITQVMNKEIDEQKKLYREFVKERTKLDEEMFAISQKAQELNKKAIEAQIQPQDKLIFNLVDLKNKFSDAMSVMTRNPERAAKIFEGIQSSVSGLIKSTQQLKLELTNLSDKGVKDIGDINKANAAYDAKRRGMPQEDIVYGQMQGDLARAQGFMQRARLAQQQGNEELMKQSATKAQELFKSAAGQANEGYQRKIDEAYAFKGRIAGQGAVQERAQFQGQAVAGYQEAQAMLVESKKQEIYDQERVNKEAVSLGQEANRKIADIKLREIAMYNEFIDAMKGIITKTRGSMDQAEKVRNEEGPKLREKQQAELDKQRQEAGLPPASSGTSVLEAVAAGKPVSALKQPEAKAKTAAALASGGTPSDVKAMADYFGIQPGESGEIGLNVVPGDARGPLGRIFAAEDQKRMSAGSPEFVKAALGRAAAQTIDTSKPAGETTAEAQTPLGEFTASSNKLAEFQKTFPDMFKKSVDAAMTQLAKRPIPIKVNVYDGVGTAQTEAYG